MATEHENLRDYYSGPDPYMALAMDRFAQQRLEQDRALVEKKRSDDKAFEDAKLWTDRVESDQRFQQQIDDGNRRWQEDQQAIERNRQYAEEKAYWKSPEGQAHSFLKESNALDIAKNHIIATGVGVAVGMVAGPVAGIAAGKLANVVALQADTKDLLKNYREAKELEKELKEEEGSWVPKFLRS